MQKPKLTTFKNGLRLLMIPMQDQRTATVLVLVEAGSKYEEKSINGLSHFLEHMCFKGTIKRPTAQHISSELDGLGAEYNAFTGQEYTGYYAKVAEQHLSKALDLVADLYINPTFQADDIEREKGVIVGEIDMRKDILPARVGEVMMGLLYGDQPAGWPIAGPKELIPTFNREQFILYRKAHYLASSTVVVVAGKFDPMSLRKEVEKMFSGMPTGKKKGKHKVKDRQDRAQVVVEEKSSEQTHLLVAVRGAHIMHDDIPALNVLGAILGGGMSSRLFGVMREELGLGYYVHASHDAYTDHGVFAVAAGVDNARVEEAVSVICGQLSNISKEAPTERELKKVKDMLAGRLALGLESSDELAEFYGFQEVLKRTLRSPEETIKRVNGVNTKDIQRVAKKYFRTERLNLALVGPAQNYEQLRKLLVINGVQR